MKKICVLAVLFGVCALADDKMTAGEKNAQASHYSYTDAQGTKWNVRQTPFGVTKWKDSDVPPPPAPQPNPVRVTDLGDSVRFERNHPFGTNVWTRKKSELTEDEKSLIVIAAGTDSEKK